MLNDNRVPWCRACVAGVFHQVHEQVQGDAAGQAQAEAREALATEALLKGLRQDGNRPGHTCFADPQSRCFGCAPLGRQAQKGTERTFTRAEVLAVLKAIVIQYGTGTLSANALAAKAQVEGLITLFERMT